MKLTKIFAPLTVVLMLGMATSAFADVTCAVSTVVVPREVLNSHWANTGDITFTCTAPNTTPTTETSITVFYSGLPITNRVPFGAPNAIQTIFNTHAINVTNGGGNVMGFAAALDTTRVDTGGTGVNQAGSLVAITIPAFTPPAAGPVGTFTLNNVVISLAGGTTSGQSVSANINVLSQTGNFVLTGAPIKIIDLVLPALSSTTNPPTLVPPILNQPANPTFGWCWSWQCCHCSGVGRQQCTSVELQSKCHTHHHRFCYWWRSHHLY
jgi:hypothetical protein